jgi:SAM-dependent methyltransferase
VDKEIMRKTNDSVDVDQEQITSVIKKELNEIVTYYDEKIALHGESPLGVDWNGSESQLLRFEQLSKLMSGQTAFSIADLGCGYGALNTYLKENFKGVKYYGYDISSNMLNSARKLHGDPATAKFIESSALLENVDFTVASGIFNVRQTNSSAKWREHIITTLDNINRYSKKGFAFNCLTMFSDTPKMKANLYYADPCFFFEYCKNNYSRNVALLHDYELYEFTIIVRR